MNVRAIGVATVVGCIVAPLFSARVVMNAVRSTAADHVAVVAIADRCALTSTGSVLCWGQNFDGRVGNGTTDFSRIAVPTTGLAAGVTAISAGGQMCAVQDGRVMCWGRYQPGPPFPETGSLVPTVVAGLPTDVRGVSVGDDHACLVTNGGAAWCWGAGGDGRLGNGSEMGPSPSQVVGLSADVVKVAAGRSHACALTTAGAVVCWGSNASGQLGNGGGGSRSTPVMSGITIGAVDVAVAQDTTCAVTNDGSSWCWGRNVYGQVGNGTTSESVTLPERTDLSGVASLSIGAVSSCARTTVGGVWCWGRNQNGEVGDGSTVVRLTPVPVTGLSMGVASVTASHGKACAVMTDGTVLCWGYNENYQLVDGTSTNRLTPVPMNFDLAAASVTQGPTSQSVPEGGATTFTAVAAGNPTPAIQWQALAPGQSSWTDLADTTPFNSSPYTGTRTDTLTLIGATRAMDATRYRVRVTNDFGEALSTEATLTVEFPPTIATQPSDSTVAAGQAATFTVLAAAAAPTTWQWQVSTDTGATWADVANGGPYTGAVTATLSVTATPVSLHHARYRVRISNAFGTAISSAAQLTVYGPLTASPTLMRFAATKAGAGGALANVTAPQTLTLGTTGAATAWTASVDRSWVQVSSAAGIGADLLTVTVADPSNTLGASTGATAMVTLTPGVAGLSPVLVPIMLTIDQAGLDTTAPYGQVDTPVQDAADIVGAVAVTGWVLDDVGVDSVVVYRACLSFDPPAACQTLDGRAVVFIGQAALLPGARPDVEAAFPTAPAAQRAGWGLLVLTPMLPHVPAGQPHGGQGAIALHVLATDAAGNRVWLGRSQHDHATTRIVLANDGIAKPFGTIDTPGQGAVVSGTVHNFGWALTPDTDTISGNGDIVIPTTGSTMVVFLDGQPVGLVAYDQCRGTVGPVVSAGTYCDDDVANLFGTTTAHPVGTPRADNPTRHRNLDAGRGAIGVYSIDTTTLVNGVHTIAWSVTDSAGRTEGIGSRFFTVLNGAVRPVAARRHAPASVGALADRPLIGAPVWARVGFDLSAPWEPVTPDAAGVRRLAVSELGRVEVSLGAEFVDGYLRLPDRLDPLPLGSALIGGVFSWTPVAGYVGDFELVFVSPAGQLPIVITIRR